MIRALIAAALMTGAAVQLLHADPYNAGLYSVVLSLGLWFFWPLLRRIMRLAAHRRGRRRHQPTRTPKTTTATPALTQVNHYHFYGQTPLVPNVMPRPDYSRPALPRRTMGQQASDEILHIIDLNDETR
ncbi:hypothetical protein Mycsm_07194 (plasmid) [Mycobacterium sp. JS623]|uniref:hypothetical protein n=1 Tax=Mycobacterium sp. JS623 TaxID=212767 RepID=UPI0002A583A9|nr:hypothetical protein [Mycobacterium sp. JS623]AGB27288.1 hypothetical protein Mycsm_07194 [Mycobacterium sp. JS623]